jgi:hypothetical protein
MLKKFLVACTLTTLMAQGISVYGAEAISLNYTPVDASTFNANPLTDIKNTIQKMKGKGMTMPSVGVLATSFHGDPFARTIKVREVNDNEIIFFSNSDSGTVQHMKDNSKVALVFYWPAEATSDGNAKQVVVMGNVDFSYKHPEARTYDVTVNGEKRSISWTAYRLVPKSVEISDYAPVSKEYSVAQSVYYTKTEMGWDKKPTSKAYVVVNNPAE